MKFLGVISASATSAPQLLDLVIRVDPEDGTGEQEWGFGYDPLDADGLTPEVENFFFDHPDFPVSPYAPPAPTPDAVWAEKDRRWALGFDYDFSDSRGVHHIATTRKDLEDWDKVSAAARAFIALGQPEATITIYTDTGPATVTALEWQSVLVAAATFFQAIMDAAAALVAMDPIPSDYADNLYWE